MSISFFEWYQAFLFAAMKVSLSQMELITCKLCVFDELGNCQIFIACSLLPLDTKKIFPQNKICIFVYTVATNI